MASVDVETVQFDQYLFGYQEGHRQLAGSRKLPDDAASILLLYSDLAPGLGSTFSPYYTALPLRSAKAVALMRTWPAPEMPRPGCVWTHAILISFSDLARIPVLGELRGVFHQPSGKLLKLSDFSHTRRFDRSGYDANRLEASQQTVLGLIDAVYDSPQGLGLAPFRVDTEEAIFDLWSQQWPRLRRSFAFQTAIVDEPAGLQVFDLTLTHRSETQTRKPADWKSAAAQDIREGRGALREFLWKFGSDIEDGKLAYEYLVKIYLAVSSPLHMQDPEETLELISIVFPEATSARTLKGAILGSEGPSLLGLSPPNALAYLSRDNRTTAFGPPSVELLVSASKYWESDGVKLVESIVRLLDRDDTDHFQMIQALTNGVNVATMLVAGASNVSFMRSLLEHRSDLVAAGALKEVPVNDLVTIATLIPRDEEILVWGLNQLFEFDNEVVAGISAGRFPREVSRKVFQALANGLAGSPEQVPTAWISSIRDFLYQSALSGLVDRCEKQSELAACALILQLSISAALQIGVVTWARAFERCKPDLEGAGKQRLSAFVLAIALARPEPGCEYIFETCFENVHADIAQSRLPYDAFYALADYLPNLYSRDQWDTCLRLRMAVVAAYVKAHLSLESFKRLSHDQVIQRWLDELATKSYDGRQFLKGR